MLLIAWALIAIGFGTVVYRALKGLCPPKDTDPLGAPWGDC